MKLLEQTVIIGGLPNPIGGVTTFLNRLVKAYPQFVFLFIDLYASDIKNIPQSLEGKYKLIPNKVLALLTLIKLQLTIKGKDFFFNFSSGNSLIFFVFLPKLNNNWSLMLHHGNLTSRLPKFILNHIVCKFDKIYTLSERQTSFYRNINNSILLIQENSYVPAALIKATELEMLPLNNAKAQKLKIVIGSGFPRKLYQHHLLLDLVEKNSNTFLFLFLYGDGELKQNLVSLKHPRITVFQDKSEDIFNFYLSQAHLYVRPTLEDSFGIACADAIEFGTAVIASNVCSRYMHVQTYDVNNNKELEIKFKEQLECI